VPCQPREWQNELLATSLNRSVHQLSNLHVVFDWDRQAREVKERIKSVCDTRKTGLGFKPEALGYPRGLSYAAALQAEGALLEALEILKHVHVMIHVGQHYERPEELNTAIASLADFARRVHRILRIRPASQMAPSRTPGLSRSVHGTASNVIPIIVRLHDALRAWHEQDAVPS